MAHDANGHARGPAPPDDLIPIAEAAKRLPSHLPGKHVHIATVHRWIATGRLQGWRRGHYWFVSAADVRAMAVAAPFTPAAPLTSGAKPKPAKVPEWVERELGRMGMRIGGPQG